MIDKERIINGINKNQEIILSNLKSKSIKDYNFIKKEFNKGNILDNLKLQSHFKSFYIMNSAGLSDLQKQRFFELLSDKEENLKYILSELCDIPRRDGKKSIQFSFATKLLHTINNNKPIYDQNLAGIINKKVEGFNKNEKINSCIKIYNYLEELYLNILKDIKIINLISKFKLKFEDAKDMSNIKILDFILWSYGDLIKKGKI